MSMTLPRWFGRKSKKKDDKECNKLKENEKQVEISTSSRTNDSTKYLTIQPNYEYNKEKRNVKAFSTFKSNVSELYEVERQNTREVANQHKEISPTNSTHFNNDHSFSLEKRTDENFSIDREIILESPAIYGGRIPTTLEDIANAKKNLRKQAFSVENLDVNYDHYFKKEQEYQNIHFKEIITNVNEREKYTKANNYQNVDPHTYQNINRIGQSRHCKSKTPSSSSTLDIASGIRNINFQHNKNLEQNGTADDGLYEVCSSPYNYNQIQSPIPINPQELRAQTKLIYMNSSHNTDFVSHTPFFTRDPTLLRGDRLRCQLVKSSRGLGFTIVGGDDNVDEFLQIKSVVPNGPAWNDGLLKTGDVLVYVNETCVLGFTHADMVSMFQSIQSGETVNLEVCRGYPLPFDPDDPNTEIVTTVAVTSPDQGDWANELERQRFSANNTNPVDVQSMPDLSANQGSVSGSNIVNRPGSADLLDYGKNDDVFESPPKVNNISRQEDLATVPITKGGMGFGFTIADSAYGQKVKKILDRPRCKTLQEGDILVEINGVSVRGMSHSEVVQVLKECSRGQEANITIQRGNALQHSTNSSPLKNKYKSKKDSDSMKPKSGFLFRSKTPTAELYASASREKENLPNRPKTPIVDTRNMRSKTPTALAPSSNPFQRNDITRASLGGNANTANNYYNSMMEQMNGMHIATGHNANLQSDNRQQNLQQYQRSKSPGNDLENDYQGYPPSMQQTQHYNHYNGYQQHPSDAPQYNHAMDYNHQNYVQYPMGNTSNQGVSYTPADTIQEPGYGYTSGTGGINYSPSGGYRSNGGYRAGSLPRGNPNAYQNNGPLGRKESTSFEHSEPLPGGLTRWPRPERRSNATHPTPNSNTEWVEMSVPLQRQDSGFGFRIVGGTEESSQVSIGHIVPDGAADVDGRLFSGDEIVAVDNVNVLNASHHQVVGLMGAAAQNGRVTITVRRRIYQQDGYGRPITNSNEMPSTTSAFSYPYDVTVSRRENEGFGFVIISSASRTGSTIGRIIAGSPAERCGRLHVGDRILAVNHVDIAGMHHGDIVNLIKDSGYSVVMTVGHPIDDASSTASTSHREEQELNLLELDDQYYAVELSRGGRGFGFSIRGGREFQSMPLFVLRIAVDGPAAADGRLRVGDQIVEINGVNTKNMTHADAIDLIKSGGTSVRLLVRRSNSGGKVPPLIGR